MTRQTGGRSRISQDKLGPGGYQPPAVWQEFARLVFEEGCSIREASRRVQVDKNTGRGMYSEIRSFKRANKVHPKFKVVRQ